MPISAWVMLVFMIVFVFGGLGACIYKAVTAKHPVGSGDSTDGSCCAEENEGGV
ncbi:MAG TPA: MetS family NSS transporter small subunit [bacterium]|nr:MetS family NSS transporter small subunit [bacterium]